MSRRGRVRTTGALAAASAATLAVLALVVTLLVDSDAAHETPAATAARGHDALDAALALPRPATDDVAPLAPPLAPASSAPRDVRPQRLVGQVVRAADGTPLAGAQVRAVSDGRDTTGTTNANGRFELTPHAPADSLVVRYQVERSWPHAPQAFGLGAAASSDELQLVYDSGFTLTGLVTDDRDRPLPWAKVGVLVNGGGLWSSRWVSSDHEGRYRVQDLTPPLQLGAIAVSAQADGHCQVDAVLSLADAAPGVRILDLRVPREGAIEVTARDPSSPSEEASRLMAIVRTESSRVLSGQSLQGGIVRVGGLPAGRHTVLVVPDSRGGGSRDAPLAPTRVDDVLVEPGAITPVEVTLQAGAIVTGRVTDESGLPLKGASVFFEIVEPDAERPADDSPAGRYARAAARFRLRNGGGSGARATGADGVFELRGVPAGPVVIVAEAKGRARATAGLELYSGERRDRVDLSLAPGRALSGRVRLADGSPMQFCTKVFVLPEDPESDEILAVAETALEGAFTADGLRPGPQRLLVVGADGSTLEAIAEPGGEPQDFVASR